MLPFDDMFLTAILQFSKSGNYAKRTRGSAAPKVNTNDKIGGRIQVLFQCSVFCHLCWPWGQRTP